MSFGFGFAFGRLPNSFCSHTGCSAKHTCKAHGRETNITDFCGGCGVSKCRSSTGEHNCRRCAAAVCSDVALRHRAVPPVYNTSWLCF